MIATHQPVSPVESALEECDGERMVYSNRKDNMTVRAIVT